MKRKAKAREEPRPPSRDCLVYLLPALCALVVLIHLAGSFFPKGRIWGINQWAYFPPAIALLSGALVLLFFIPSLNEAARRGLSSLASRVISFLDSISGLGGNRRYLVYSLFSALFFIPFWLLRERVYFLGDGAQIISRLNSGELAVHWAEPLEIYLHVEAFNLVDKLWQVDSSTVYAILS
ncbi:MAG: hypothetical protein WBC77_08005, partial [Candidatus Zixiibacteriota bacterium]